MKAQVQIVFSDSQTKYFKADDWHFTDNAIVLHFEGNQTIVPLQYILYAVVEDVSNG